MLSLLTSTMFPGPLALLKGVPMEGKKEGRREGRKDKLQRNGD